jgi:hypothetical protein
LALPLLLLPRKKTMTRNVMMMIQTIPSAVGVVVSRGDESLGGIMGREEEIPRGLAVE